MVTRAITALVVLAAAPALAQPFPDALVQAPGLAPPQRGSLAGPLAREAFGPGELGSGVFSLHAPIELPDERGRLEADPFPSYSPEHGIGPWGLGWRADLAIRRFRVAGHLDYRTDERIGPWGRMQRGSDGAWYPTGLRTAVRVVETGASLVAYLPGGSRWRFGTATREVTAEGTYAWALDAIEAIDGSGAAFYYDRVDDQLRLRRISYGGTGTAYQVRVELGYEPVARPYVTVASGEPVRLSSRVKTIDVLARDAGDGAFRRRWRYTLGYDDDEWGIAFYLVTIQRTYGAAGDAADPAITFTYARPASIVTAARFTRVAKAGPLLAALSAEVVQPHRSAQLDVDGDGLVDLEVARDLSLIRQTPSGFVIEAAPPGPAQPDPRCRPAPDPANAPRLLVRPSPASDDRVVSLVASGDALHTELRVCGRDGARLSRQILDGVWEPGALTRLVDVTGDQVPDLVQLGPGRVTVRAATAGGSYQFGPPRSAVLTPEVPVDTLWVHDWNGDGIADLIGRTRGGLVVWLGRGRGRFVEHGSSIGFETGVGPIDDITVFQLTFVDVNRDGMVDVVLTRGQDALVYVNRGAALVERKVAGLAAIDWQTGAPVVADLAGTGEVALAAVKDRQLWAIDLTAPGGGLLAGIDDGRGVTEQLRYTRADAAPGLRARPITLAGVTLAVAGESRTDYAYGYADPAVDAATGTFLGFARVHRAAPHITEEVVLRNTPLIAGLVTHAITFDDRDAAIEHHVETVFDDAMFRGVAFARRRSERMRWVQRGGPAVAAGETIDYLTYSGVCPTVTRRTAGGDRLVTTTQLAAPARLASHLHCLDSRRALRGTHARGELDFTHTAALQRDDAGRMIQLDAVADGGAITLQHVDYAAGLVTAIASVDRGRQVFGWDAATRQLVTATGADGVVTRVSRDPLTGAIRELRHDGGAPRVEQFRYDPLERLAARWDDLGDSTEAMPDVRYEYALSTATRPGQIRERTLVDARTTALRDAIDLVSAGGAVLGTATDAGGAWTLPELTLPRGEGTTDVTLRRPLAPGIDPRALSFDALADPGAQDAQLGRSIEGAHGRISNTERWHADAERVTAHRRDIVDGALRDTVTVAGQPAYSVVLGPDGRVAERVQADGARYRYLWDRRGRLRGVDLPDGKRAAIDVDGYGRVSGVTWQGWLAIRTSFAAGSMLPLARRYLAADGTLLQQVDYVHDRRGRTIAETWSAPGATALRFARTYDLAPPACGWTATEPGQLVAESGPGYRTCYRHDAGGRLVARTDEIAGWRTLSTELAYHDDGSLRSEAYHLAEPGKPAIAALGIEHTVDAAGREAGLRIPGGETIALDRDAQGRVWRARSGPRAGWLERDATTALAVGVGGSSGALAWRHRAHLGATGDPDEERFAIGPAEIVEHHAVTPGGFLARTSGGPLDQAFSYAPGGRLAAITDHGTTAPIAPPVIDRLGRVTGLAGADITYGPDSQPARVIAGGHSYTFVHDADGRQRARLVDGTVERAELAGLHIQGDHLYWPVRLEDRVVGFVVDGAFQPAALDGHGTEYARGAAPRLVDPYGSGARSDGPLDYHGGAAGPAGIRFGSRDYAPSLGGFLTPDRTFLDDPAGCVDHPIDCNLYGFAGGNPTRASDTSGAVSHDDYQPPRTYQFAVQVFHPSGIGGGLDVRIDANWDFSVRLDLGVRAPGPNNLSVNVGATSRGLESNDVALVARAEAYLRAWGSNVLAVQSDVRLSMTSGLGADVNASAGPYRAGLKLSLDPDRSYGYQDWTGRGELPTARSLKPRDANVRPSLLLRVTMNSEETVEGVGAWFTGLDRELREQLGVPSIP